MKIADIATAKSQLSQLLRRVKCGETIIITECNRPVAQLVPVIPTDQALSRAFAAGLLLPPKGPPLDVEAFLKARRPRVAQSASLVKAVLEEREEAQ